MSKEPPLVKLLDTPLPVDRVAARVVKPAAPENLWRPLPKFVPTAVRSTTALPVAPIPFQARYAVAHVLGQRRDRMTVVGYAADQLNPHQQAKWVTRCDCGNYEHRTRILRWLGTKAPDMCAECRNRKYKLVGEWSPRTPAERTTREQGGAP